MPIDKTEGGMIETPLTDASISWRTAYASTGVGNQKISMRVDYIEVDDCRAIERYLREEISTAVARAEQAERERDEIAGLNHDQFLELTYLRRIFKAADQLYVESEEYDFDDGMGRGAQQDLWDALADAFEPETEAIKEVIDAALAKEPK